MSRSVDIRVTRLWRYDKELIKFSGVPLNNDKRVKTGKQVVVVESIPDCVPLKPAVGQIWRINGDIRSAQVNHGGFYITELHMANPEKMEVTMPDSGEDFVKFIANESTFKGIGKKKARELWYEFGNTIYTLLAQKLVDPFKPLLSHESIKALFEGYQKYDNLKYAHWFAQHNIPPYVTQRLFRYHNSDSVKTIQDNPYHLVTFGLPFSKVDKIAQNSFNIDSSDDRRLRASIESALLKHSKDGHTVARQQDLKPSIRKLLGSNELATKALTIGYKKAAFIFNEERRMYHTTALLIMEKVIAKRLLKLTNKGCDWFEEHKQALNKALEALDYPLTDKQMTAVTMAMSSAMSIITGGAGTGKTTVLSTVLKGYKTLGYDIRAMALSGRAAMRLHESTDFITGTIARFLRETPIEKKGKYLVVIDEASMIDLPTMYQLVTHVDPCVRFLLVGDPDQLPPIGPGLILHDIVISGTVANTRLDIVKRQKDSTGIPEYSNYIRQGIIPPKLSTGNIHFHDVTLDEITDCCVQLYATEKNSSQIVGSTYKSPQGGIDNLNKDCRIACNADGQQLEFEIYDQKKYLFINQNDPVIFIKNHYEIGIQNGTMGQVISVDKTETSHGVVLIDTGELIELTTELLDSIRPGYAISLHKAQGSQFKRVIVPINKSRMLDRNWLYTAVTRAETEIHLVGPKHLLFNAIKKQGAVDTRQTNLLKLLEEEHYEQSVTTISNVTKRNS